MPSGVPCMGGWAFHCFQTLWILLDRMLTAGLGSWMVAVWPLDWRDGRYFRNFQDDHSSLEAVQINSIDFYRNIQKHHENLSFGVPHFMGNFFHDHRTYG